MEEAIERPSMTKRRRMYKENRENAKRRKLKDFYTKLEDAIRNDDMENALKLLRHNRYDSDTLAKKPLLLAIELGKLSFVKLLICRGANMNWRGDGKNDSPELLLHCACDVGNLEVVRVLLIAGAYLERRDLRCRTALGVAVEANKPEIADLLLAYGAAIDLQWPDVSSGRTVGWQTRPRHGTIAWLLDNDMQRMVKTLLRHGVPLSLGTLMKSPKVPVDPDPLASVGFINGTARLLLEYGVHLGPLTGLKLETLPHAVTEELRVSSSYEWLKEQLTGPATLKRLCRLAIRMHLVTKYKRSILRHLSMLGLPDSLVRYLSLGTYILPAL